MESTSEQLLELHTLVTDKASKHALESSPHKTDFFTVAVRQVREIEFLSSLRASQICQHATATRTD